MIPFTQQVTAPIAPATTASTYPSYLAEWGKNFFWIVDDLNAWNLVPPLRRYPLSYVVFRSTLQWYLLEANLTTLTPVASPGGGTVTLTGDITGSGTGTIVTNLSNTGVTAGTYGSATQVGRFIVDAKGRITSAVAIPIQITEAQVTGLVGKYIPVTDKGASNGVAPLVGGIVPLANLPPGTPNQYLGLYNASTNIPAIINGTGIAGEFYIANVIGNAYAPVNVTIVNQIVAYDGSVWQVGAVFTGGIAQITTDAGVQVAPAATIDTTLYIAPQGDRQYNTQDQKDALDNSVTPLDATNPVVSEADLNAAIAGISVTVTNEFNTPERYEDGLNDLGQNTISPQFMNTLTNPVTGVAYTTASMMAAYPLTPVSWTAANATYTDVCVNAAMRGMELAFGSAALTFHDNRIYQYNQGVEKATVSQWSSFWKPDSWVFQGNSSRHFNISGVAKPIWYRIPPNQGVAFGGGNAWTGYKTLMYNMSFYGANLGIRDNGDCCLIDCASYGSIYQGCVFTSADVGLNLYGTLHARVIGGSMGGNSRSGIKCCTGFGDGIEAPRWTGATLTNSASNGSFFSPSNVNCANNSFSGIELYGSDGLSVGGDAQIAFEGSGGTSCQHHVYYDGQSSTLCKIFKARNFHLEQQVSVSHICVKDYGQIVTAYLGEISPFLSAPTNMFEARTNPAGGGTVSMWIDNCPNLDVGWKLRQIGVGSSGRWHLDGVQVFDQTNIYAAINWNVATINGLTGSIVTSPFGEILRQTP